MKIFRFKDNGSTVPNRVEEEDYTDVLGTSVQFPHCDALILHSPGACEFCDRHPDWQALRSGMGVAFSDTPEEMIKKQNLVPCPSTHRRPAEVRDLWPGNVPSNTNGI